MKKLTIITAALGTLSAFTSLALAEDMTSKSNIDKMMTMCDTNKDGKISKAEYTEEKMKAFSKYDTNNDGMLSKEEHKSMAMSMHDKLMGEKHMDS
jgi:Ca2+-binding EF-hand superfamily protein